MICDQTMGSFRILEHTADIGFEAYGETEEETLANASMALVSIITDPDSIKIVDSKTVEVKADDNEQLLVRYLNEVLYIIDGESFLPAKATVQREKDFSLRAVLHGETRTALHDVRTDVKAITYHQLKFEKTDSGYVIRVFVDI